jgi:hypothetical protein
MKVKLTLIAFLLQSLSAFACLSAKQHKLFPVGMHNTNIIFIEHHIYRTEDFNKNDKKRHDINIKWKIRTYISVYDTSQNLISTTEIDDSEIKGDSYLPLLKSTYTKGLFKIKALYKNLDYFKADYLSFCDYQKKCKKVELTRDSITKKDFLRYKKTSHNVKLTTTEKDRESAFFTDDLSAFYLNSIRVYKAKHTELVVGHLATGHEVSMGWITNNPNKTSNEEDSGPAHIAKPYAPDFELKDLHIPVYEEPFMHHGNGYDLFIVKQN